MKKIVSLITGTTVIVVICILINACQKKESITPENQIVPKDLLDAAKDWQLKKTNSSSTLSINVNNYILQPIWKEVKYMTLTNGKSLIIVSSPIVSFDASSTLRGLRKFIFTVDKGRIVDGQIVEVFGSPDLITAHKESLVENLSSGADPDFTGYKIVYDLNYRYLNSSFYEKGKKIDAAAMIRGDNGEHKDPGVKGGSENQIVTLGQCYAYYLVSTNLSTGSQTWTYLYTACGGAGGYGDGGGSSPGPSTPIGVFGINNSNAQISDTNFDDFLNYVRGMGIFVSSPYNGTVMVNGTL